MNWSRAKTKFITRIVLGIIAMVAILELSELIHAEEDMSHTAPAMFEVVVPERPLAVGIAVDVTILHEIGADALWLLTCGQGLAPYTTGWWCSDCKTVRYEPNPTYHCNEEE